MLAKRQDAHGRKRQKDYVANSCHGEPANHETSSKIGDAVRICEHGILPRNRRIAAAKSPQAGANEQNSLLSVRCPGSSARFPPDRAQTNLRGLPPLTIKRKPRETPTRRLVSFKERGQLYHCKGVAVFLPRPDVRKSLILGHILTRSTWVRAIRANPGLRPICSEDIYSAVSHRGHDGRSRAEREKPGRGLA